MVPWSRTVSGEARFLEVGQGDAARLIAVRRRSGAAPGVMWLGGFKSDMRGTKAMALDAWAAEHGRACLRFDYSGHGESGGTFPTAPSSRWSPGTPPGFGAGAEGPRGV